MTMKAKDDPVRLSIGTNHVTRDRNMNRKLRTYRCEFMVFLNTRDGASSGSLRVKLPFIPKSGMKFFGIIRSGDEEDDDVVDDVDVEVKDVVYRIRDGSFILDIGKYEHEPTYEETASIDFLKSMFIGDWKWEDFE